jgi:rRNA processing protein Gar1
MIAYLFFLTTLTYAGEIHKTDMTLQRVETLAEASDTVQKTPEYQELKIEVQKLNDRVKELDKRTDPANTKKQITKTIGYTSSVIGFINSIWGMVEKSMSLANNRTDLAIRLSTKESITKEINEYEKDPELNAQVLNRKMEALGEINEKIANIETRIKINRLGFNRGIFKGVTSVALFALTFFSDDISKWYEKTLYSDKRIADEFLYSWWIHINEAGILPIETQSMTLEQKSLFFFAGTESLGIDEGVFLEEMYRYSKDDPEHFKMFRELAQKTLTEMLKKETNQELEFVIRRLNEKDFKPDWYYAPTDGTRIKPITDLNASF